ncbi:phage holin family protein [Streptomyces yangpuensis]|uniref:phage holin family protein n=1 Tax=Streptomyces yangpuensis TaxID=1648182 RepID=UPI00382EB7DB
MRTAERKDRNQMRLARAEMTRRGPAVQASAHAEASALLVAVIAALALLLPVWASALVTVAAPGAVTAVMAAAGRKQVAEAGAPAPQQAIDSVKADVAEIKEALHR